VQTVSIRKAEMCPKYVELLCSITWHHNPEEEVLELYKGSRRNLNVTKWHWFHTVTGTDDGGGRTYIDGGMRI